MLNFPRLLRLSSAKIAPAMRLVWRLSGHGGDHPGNALLVTSHLSIPDVGSYHAQNLMTVGVNRRSHMVHSTEILVVEP